MSCASSSRPRPSKPTAAAPVNVYEEGIAAQRQEAMTYLEQLRARVEANGLTARVKLLDGDAAAALGAGRWALGAGRWALVDGTAFACTTCPR